MDKKVIFKGLNGGALKVENVRNTDVVLIDCYVKDNDDYALFLLENGEVVGSQSKALINWATNYIACDMNKEPMKIRFELAKTKNGRDTNIITIL